MGVTVNGPDFPVVPGILVLKAFPSHYMFKVSKKLRFKLQDVCPQSVTWGENRKGRTWSWPSPFVYSVCNVAFFFFNVFFPLVFFWPLNGDIFYVLLLWENVFEFSRRRGGRKKHSISTEVDLIFLLQPLKWKKKSMISTALIWGCIF